MYKNQGDIQNCTHYIRIKLTCHTMKLWGRVIERRLGSISCMSITENQFGLCQVNLLYRQSSCLRPMSKIQRKRKILYLVFIDVEKAYDMVPSELIWWIFVPY